MNHRWVGLLFLAALGCRSKGGEAGAAASSSAAAAAVAAPAAAKIAPDGTCSTKLEYLVPPQKYGNSDLIRAIASDGDQVFFRDMSDYFRVPLAGGAPVRLGKAPALSLSGKAGLWLSGNKLLAQSPGEPIFMSAAKSGGEWSTFLDLTKAKLGGGRDVTTRILSGLGKSTAQATRADFDGKTFYFAEITRGKGRNAPSSSVLKSVPLEGGEPRSLFQTTGEIEDVRRTGDRVTFLLTLPPTAEQIRQNEAERKAKKYVFGVKGESHLMSVPLAGGEAKKLVRIGPFMSGLGLGGVALGTDGSRMVVSGFRDEALTKPGIFRVDAASGSVEELDKRVLSGAVFVSGESLVFIGGGMVDPGKTQHGQLVLTAPRTAKSLTLSACITERVTLHASAVTGKVALLALFDGSTNLASIAKVALP
jgi:hypothetical protein